MKEAAYFECVATKSKPHAKKIMLEVKILDFRKIGNLNIQKGQSVPCLINGLFYFITCSSGCGRSLTSSLEGQYGICVFEVSRALFFRKLLGAQSQNHLHPIFITSAAERNNISPGIPKLFPGLSQGRQELCLWSM